MKHIRIVSMIILLSLSLARTGRAQDDIIYEESRVPEYVLPDLFTMSDGITVSTPADWESKRRPEILGLFEEHVYGVVPGPPDSARFDIVNEDARAMNGAAHLKEIDIHAFRNGKSLPIRLNVFIPNGVPRPAPVFLLISHRDPDDIDPTRSGWNEFWPADAIVSAGYAAAAFDVGDVADDDGETYREDLLSTLYPELIDRSDATGALAAWAWGAMRAMDYFAHDPDIDATRSAVVGHSRGGKAALWTGAVDPRWAITISNESGEAGAALSRRRFGETVERITTVFPYWFAPNFATYANREDALPVDQHMLIGLIAPRAVYVASAQEDLWADPRGEYLSLRHGTAVHRSIYGLPVDLPEEMPDVNQPIATSVVGHHMREGKHDLLLTDWQRFLRFADKIFGSHD